jgi:hypothetical protein
MVPKIQKPHQRDVLNAAGGEAKRIELELHPRPVERATTRDANGGGENKLHGVNIAGDRNCVKPEGARANAGKLAGAGSASSQ